MYALGVVCSYAVLPASHPDRLYGHLWTELFVDVGALTVVLSVLPQKLSVWLKRAFYVVAYGVALADVFCYVRFDSTLTPTMLLLVGETNGQEAGEFLSSFLTFDVIFSRLGWVLLLMLVHMAWAYAWKKHIKWRPQPLGLRRQLVAAMAFALLFCYSLSDCWSNKQALHRLMSYDKIGDVEHELTETKTCANLYQPLYRLAFSIRANQLTAQQVDKLIAGIDKVTVDSCRYDCTNLVLIIGESYNRHHAQLYGYAKPTTPRQLDRARRGELTVFQDVVAPWNLTSFVFKHVLSMHAVGDSGEWCDAPLFPEVFRRAGYRVTMITNQFQSRAKEPVWDFSGGFFLNDPAVSGRQFNVRNTKTYRYDEGVLKAFDAIKGDSAHNLYILHLMGSHVDYRARYPEKTRSRFKPEMYNRPKLSDSQRQLLAEYDNSLLYNDSIVAAITQRFENRDAVVIYMPDHGEEIFDDEPIFGRLHSAEVDYRLARNEMEIPFWIWGSPAYREHHPYGWLAIQNAKDRPLMTDVLPHLLLYLGGISTPLYRDELNVISPNYDTKRPRILKGETDYNQLKK
jgi:heptose-I-phosphate ethanolaminephosphotransferase